MMRRSQVRSGQHVRFTTLRLSRRVDGRQPFGPSFSTQVERLRGSAPL